MELDETDPAEYTRPSSARRRPGSASRRPSTPRAELQPGEMPDPTKLERIIGARTRLPGLGGTASLAAQARRHQELEAEQNKFQVKLPAGSRAAASEEQD